MNSRKLSIILIIIFAYPLLPQKLITISGTVFDYTTQKPLKSANAYISNSSFGTSTDIDGHYKIKSIPYGSFELIASYVGYKTKIANLSIYKDTSLIIDFYLEQKPDIIKEIDVSAPKPNEWLSDFRIFKTEFLGQTENAELTKILNPEVINLKYNETENILTATSDSIVIIDNNALGYKLFVQIDTICFNTKTKKYTFSFSSRVEEMKPKSDIEKTGWEKNRKMCYTNSFKYFCRSIFYNELEQNEFSLHSASKLSTLQDALGIWTSPNCFKLSYNHDSSQVHFTYNKYLRVKKGHESIINFGNQKITIDKFGNVLKPKFVEMYKWWGSLRIADLLPFDYVYKK